MIFGLGTDIVDVQRMEERLTKNPALLNHIFSIDEQFYCQSTKKPAMHFAARFAVKEAFLKAFGLTFIGNHALPEIEVQKDVHGKPNIVLHNKTLVSFQELNLKNILVSISHTDEMAMATVIIEM
jgi:holo-[acyl-carrier protein] synthase